MTTSAVLWHTIHMKRTNLVLDATLLDETLKASGERTYSRAVERAMREFVQRTKARRILDFAGSGEWSGDLAVVREDHPSYGAARNTRKGKHGPR